MLQPKYDMDQESTAILYHLATPKAEKVGKNM